jgi:hypothetical protein
MSKFHNEAPSVVSVAKVVDDSIMGKPERKGSLEPKVKANTDTKTAESSTPKKKTSYSEAYKKRDMKTYGDLTEAEYTAEAKRQNKSKKETGKWDAPKKPMKSNSKGETKVEPKKTEVKEKSVTTENNASEDKKKKSELIKEKNTKKVDEINKKGDEKVEKIKERKARREARRKGRQDRREARRNRRQKVKNARKGVETTEESVATYKKK